MNYIYAANVERGQSVRRTIARGDTRHAYGEFAKVVDILKRAGEQRMRLLLDDGQEHRDVAPEDVLEIKPTPVAP